MDTLALVKQMNILYLQRREWKGFISVVLQDEELGEFVDDVDKTLIRCVPNYYHAPTSKESSIVYILFEM